jgi:heptosyltransferase-2
MFLKDCENLLVRSVNWVGDAVMTMSALRALKLSRPKSKITLLANPWVSPLFEKDPHVDEIILYNDNYKSLTGKFRLASIIKKNRFCAAFLFQNAIDAAIISFLANIPERIGYNRDRRGFLLTKAIPFDAHAKGLHHVQYYMNLLEQAGVITSYADPWIYLAVDERLGARSKLSDLRRPIVAINPGATYGSSKRWSPERFAEVAARVIDELNGSILILGGPSENEIAEKICEKMEDNRLRSLEVKGTSKKLADPAKFTGSELLNMSSKTTLRELAAVISESDLLVTNDSGPMHISYAVRTPVVAIFGSTSPELTGPVGKSNIIIKKDVGCSPCFQRECSEKDLICMNDITADEVFNAVREMVGRNKRRAVFLDRDGTLCKDMNYLSRIEDLEIFSAVSNLKRLKENGYRLFGVTNQSGIARDIVTEDFVKRVNTIFMEQYGFDGFYYCPHHPDEHCSCRKPEPGLLFDARADHGVDLKRSVIVGDKDLDMKMAKSVGAVGILVRTGKESYSKHADFIAKNIEEAVNIILRNN